MDKPILVERFADNGDHSHWELVTAENSELLWSELKESENFDNIKETEIVITNSYKKYLDWLTPLGYTQVFDNHPNLLPREFHFAKDGIRVICVINESENYCYLYKDIIKISPVLAIKTGRIDLGNTDSLNLLVDSVKMNSEKLAVNSVPLTTIDEDILDMCVNGYKNGEKLVAIKLLIEHTKNQHCGSFSIKWASELLENLSKTIN